MRWCIVVGVYTLWFTACATARLSKPNELRAAPSAQVTRLPRPTLTLPTEVQPRGYRITARIVPSAEQALVTTEISVHLSIRTDQLWLNATGLEFGAAAAQFEQRDVAATIEVQGEQLALMHLESPIGPGDAVLRLSTQSPLSHRDAEGIFASREGADWYAYTQFEPLSARRAFPCFDEPRFKVPFEVTLEIPPELEAFSNAPIRSSELKGEFKVVTFEKTRPLPTYLVAFAVGPFEVLDAGEAGARSVPVRVITPRGQTKRALGAAKMTQRLLPALERWFGTSYPFEKIDHLAVANSNFGGAMENPGLITYSQSLLLAAGDDDTVSRQRALFETMAHELAHQWFGNLVTLTLWDDVWLNESFATWIEGLLVKELEPSWPVELERIEARDGALQHDALLSARRIREPIGSEDDVLNAFDEITYSKGAAVLHMFEQWVGPLAFRDAVRSYLEHHAFGSASTADFTSELSARAGRPLAPALATFLDQRGVPLVTASVDCKGPPRLELRQRRLSRPGVVVGPQVWQIPLCVRADTTRHCLLLDGEATTVPLERCPRTVMPNDAMAGYFRFSPLDRSWVKDADRPLPERVGLLGELGALVDAQDASVTEQLELVPQLAASGQRQLVSYASWPLWELDGVLPERSQRQLAAMVRRHFGPIARRLSWSRAVGEGDEARLMRPSMLRLVGDLGADASLSLHASQLVARWLKVRSSLAPELVGVALTLAAQHGSPALFDALLSAARAETDRKTRHQLLAALGSFQSPTLVARAQALLLDEAFEMGEVEDILWVQVADRRTRDAAWRFTQAHYDALVQRLPADSEASLVNVGVALCDRSKRAEVVAFFEPRTPKAPGGPRLYANAIEQLDRCIAWAEAHGPAAQRFLESQR